MTSIEEFIKNNGIKMKECNRIHRNPNMPDFKGDNWKVVLHTPGKGVHEFVTYFSKGFGHMGKRPSTREILECMASDAAGYENSNSLEDWAIEYGYDPEFRRTETIYENVKKEAIDLETFLGKEAYDQLLWETEGL